MEKFEVDIYLILYLLLKGSILGLDYIYEILIFELNKLEHLLLFVEVQCLLIH